jgi:hypothetical protein
MNRYSLIRRIVSSHLFATVVVALAGIALATPVSAQEGSDLPTQLFKVTNVSLHSAHTLATGVCRAAGAHMVTHEDGSVANERNCADIGYLEDESMLSVTATQEVIARVAALLAEFDRLPETRAFQIIVLAADRSGENSSDIPANVQDALQDVRDFLPYNGFSVLGSGWLRTSSHGETTLPGSMDLSAELAFRPTTDPTAPLLIEHFRVRSYVMAEAVVDGVVTRVRQDRSVIETTFTINPGDTVVVGVSKLNGNDTAVVVLLTAIQD